MFYHAFTESLLSFPLLAWYRHIALKKWNSVYQIVKRSSWLIGEPLLNPASLNTRQVQRIGTLILSDQLHQRFYQLQYLLFDLQFRAVVLKWRYVRKYHYI